MPKLQKWAILFLISSIGLLGCKQTPYQKEQKIFSWYLETVFHQKIPQDSVCFLLVPGVSCTGCKKSVAQYYNQHKNPQLYLIMESGLDEMKDVEPSSYVWVDNDKVLGSLNWDAFNITEIRTQNEKIIFFKNYTADEVIKRFLQ